MKTTASKENPASSISSQSFFNINREGSFLSLKNEVEQPFFSPSPFFKNNTTSGSFSKPCAVVQPKLTINKPGDQYEQEADAMADQVMRMPHTPLKEEGKQVQRKAMSVGSAWGSQSVIVQRECATCEQEEKLQRQEMGEEEFLQAAPLMRKSAGGGYTASSQLVSQLNSSKGGGSPLPEQTLGFMNQAFGADFSKVRIHDDSQSAEMSKGIQAKAFTHGSDIYFNRGHYNPELSEGKRLLGHELTHVVQQGGAGRQMTTNGSEPVNVARSSDLIQRDIGLEFQASNVISQKKGTKKFSRVQTKKKPLRKIGNMELQVDTGSVMEFQTGHYSKWSDLKKDLDAVMAVITEIESLNKEPLDPKKTANSTTNPLVYRGFKTGNYGKVDITVNKGTFWGKPQANEEIALSEFTSMLKENDGRIYATEAIKEAGSMAKGLTKSTPNLTNFIEIIVYHLKLLQRNEQGLMFSSDGKITQPKAFLRLMNKVDYTAMYQFLSPNEQKEFQKLVSANPNPIAAAAGVSMTDDLFKVGYWGWHPDRSGSRAMRVLIQQGKIVMIQKKIRGVVGMGANKDIHKCGDPGVPKRYCTTKKPIKHVTVQAWLQSIITPAGASKKSITAPLPTYAGTKGAGYSWGLTDMTAPGMFLFEMRGYNEMKIKEWPKFAEGKFNYAANCRPGSKLVYDGKLPKPKCKK